MKKSIILLFCAALFVQCSSPGKKLESEFVTPPSSVQTSVYWYWMCGNISKEGVVEDLKQMKRVGINRAFIGNIYFDPYEGGRNVKLMSEEWWEVTHTALKTAAELDIEIGIFNSPGWTQAGGPWVKPNQAMRYLTSSEVMVSGPAKVSLQLEKPATEFEDVKVIAYPAPKDSHLKLDASNSKFTVSPRVPNPDMFFDGQKVQGLPLERGVDYVIDVKANNGFTARSLTIYPTHDNINAKIELQAKVGGEFKTISEFVIDWHHRSLIVGFQPHSPVVLSLDETTASEFRILAKNRNREGGIAEIEISASPRIESFADKTFAKMSQDPMPMWDYYMWRDQPEVSDASLNVDPAKVIDISEFMNAEGMLNWSAPQGEWVILRTGMTPTGVTNNPGGPDGTGLETDKMSKEHIAAHFDQFIGKILERIPAQDRRTFKVVVQDSYESGGTNFTDDFLAQFQQRYGYSALPYIPAYFGKVVGTEAQSDRFLWDMRRLVADKVAYDYVGGFREICHKHGLTTWLENYGHWGFPGEFLMYGGQSDEVGGEFWIENAYPSWENNLGNIENRAASSCAHIYGKNLASAESSTSGAPSFSRTPAQTKKRTDKYFTEGINNTLFHVFIHQPDLDKYPGTNAWFGTEFTRTNTWYSQMDLYVDYIKRCNYMLRQGLNIADVAYFIGEDTPKMTGIQDPALPNGYQFDYINAEVLLRDATVRDGFVTLPHGTKYRVLVLPKVKTMRPELLAKIKQMVNDGAVVLGPMPTHSPSLQNQPQADSLVSAMAGQLWGAVDGVSQTMGRVGKGWLFNGVSLEEVFKAIGYTEDCKVGGDAPILFGHREMDGIDIYFLSNQGETAQRADITFRVEEMQPELWNPMNGTFRLLTEFSSTGAMTTVPLYLEEHESAFIVFRKKGKPVAGTRNFNVVSKTVELTNAWDVEFNGKLTNPAPIKLDTLQDISTYGEDRVKYFSGDMIYRTTFDFDLAQIGAEDVLLDLGEVNVMAKVWVNDKYVGGVWTMPHRVNLTKVLKQGENTLRVEVVNTWINRLIGDQQLPKEQRETWVGMSPYKQDSPLTKSGLVGPVRLQYMPR